MRRISSSMTFFYKTVFPCVWFGFIGLFFIGALTGAILKNSSYVFLIMPVFMGGLGIFIMKQLVWNLVDEVWDHGDFLVAKNKGQEARIDLRNIINVSHTSFTNPPSISLHLRAPCELGQIIRFSPPPRLFSFREHPIATELIHRIDEKRQSGS